PTCSTSRAAPCAPSNAPHSRRDVTSAAGTGVTTVAAARAPASTWCGCAPAARRTCSARCCCRDAFTVAPHSLKSSGCFGASLLREEGFAIAEEEDVERAGLSESEMRDNLIRLVFEGDLRRFEEFLD